jgi:hypothetical protein
MMTCEKASLQEERWGSHLWIWRLGRGRERQRRRLKKEHSSSAADDGRAAPRQLAERHRGCWWRGGNSGRWTTAADLGCHGRSSAETAAAGSTMVSSPSLPQLILLQTNKFSSVQLNVLEITACQARFIMNYKHLTANHKI